MTPVKVNSLFIIYCLLAVIIGQTYWCITRFQVKVVNLNNEEKIRRDSLHDIGLKYETDKVYQHHYDNLYEKYLTHYRGTSLRFLEIGLGCGMERGTGASAQTWREYFGADADIHFLEYNKRCGEKWYEATGRKLNITMHYGSQSDISFLRQLILDTNSFDVIIDDGGHTMNQQQTSFNVLLPFVRSGGLYVIEDLESSYIRKYGGAYGDPSTTITFIKNIIDEVQSKAPKKNMPIAKRISSFEIGDNICFFSVK